MLKNPLFHYNTYIYEKIDPWSSGYYLGWVVLRLKSRNMWMRKYMDHLLWLHWFWQICFTQKSGIDWSSCLRQRKGERGFGIQSPEDYRWRLRIAAAAKFRWLGSCRGWDGFADFCPLQKPRSMLLWLVSMIQLLGLITRRITAQKKPTTNGWSKPIRYTCKLQ